MNTKQRVEAILRAVPKTRDSDKELLIIFMQKAGMELSDRQIAKFKTLPSMETIRRIRQDLQQKGKYPASKAVEDERFNKFNNWRDIFDH